MSRSLFGTDGVRGRANSEPMTAEIAMRIGMAAGQVFNRGGHRHRVVIGKDTRLSGYMIEQALTAGFLSVGVDVLLLGPLPTPAVGFLTRSMRADVGVMISASHNPYEDNGIKLFGPDGFKLSDAVEMQIEDLVEESASIRLAAPAAIGRAKRLDDAEGRYIEAVKASAARGLDLSGLRIVVDCANGAAYKAAPTVLWELGAEVIPLAVSPDGFNINGNCGSTHPALLQEHVEPQFVDVKTVRRYGGKVTSSPTQRDAEDDPARRVARRLQHQRQLWLDASGAAAGTCRDAQRQHRHRPGRRRRPRRAGR